MMTVVASDGRLLHYRITGALAPEDLATYYATLNRTYRAQGRVRLLVEVRDFTGYTGWRSVAAFLRHEYTLLYKVERYAAVANQRWFRRVINGLGRVVPGVKVRAFPAPKLAEARRFLSAEDH